MKNTKNELPLSGIKVVELATVVAAPTAGRLLSDYGADVIKIETPGKGDLLRPIGSGQMLPAQDDNNPLFDVFNSGKKLLSLNVKAPEGRKILNELLGEADIFISNIRMKSLVHMGLDYDSVKKDFPRLIYAHFSGFGLTGPEEEKPGFDYTAFWLHTGGAIDMQTPGAYPLRPTFGFGDIVTASGFLSGMLMALIGREKTGHGTLVSSSLFGSGIWCNSSFVLDSQPQYGRQYPVDRYSPWDPLTECYQCKDGKWLGIAEKVYEKDRHTFAKIFNMKQFENDPDFETLDKLRETGHIAQVTKAVENVMRTKTSDEWQKILDDNDIPNQLAFHFRDIAESEQAWDNEFLEEVEYPGHVKTAVPTPPIQFSEYGRKPFEKSGPVGRDTDEVLKSMGLSDEQIKKLHDDHIV